MNCISKRLKSALVVFACSALLSCQMFYLKAQDLVKLIRASSPASLVRDISKLKEALTGKDINAPLESGLTPLLEAVSYDKPELVKELIALGAHVNAPSKFGTVPLESAQSPEVIKLLVDAGADLNAKDVDGRTLLDRALEDRNLKRAQVLLSAGAEASPEVINKVDSGYNNNSWLHKEVLKDNKDWAKVLLAAGADPNLSNKYGSTPLHDVKSVEVAQMLLAAGANPLARSKSSNTPLDDAKRHGSDQMVKLLTDAQVQFDKSLSPLDKALLAQNLSQVQALVALGARASEKIVNKRDSQQNNSTWLHQEVVANNKDWIKALLAAGADPNVSNKLGSIPLHDARDAEVAQMLIAAGAQINAKSNSGNTPLLDARNNELAQIKVLLAAGADPKIANNTGETVLHKATSGANIKYLVSHGANVNARNKQGLTPLHTAQSLEAAQALIKSKADLNAVSNSGETPLVMAIKHNNPQIAKLLINSGAAVKRSTA